MKASRISLALDAGYALPEEGVIAVVGPQAGVDLSDLPEERAQIVQRFKPDFDYWQGLGFDCVVEPQDSYSAAILFLPRSKTQALAQIAELAGCVGDGPIWIDGQKTDGVDSILKQCRARGTIEGTLSKAHGRIFVFYPAQDALQDWVATPTEIQNFVTLPGVFSADGVDRASHLLAEALPDMLKGRVADLGAGWGYLSYHGLRRFGVTEMHLIEADHVALECARQNIHDPRARFHWADATRFDDEGRFDHVISNPPFHTGRAADPELGKAFLGAAARLLSPGGHLWVVANRQLPYEQTLAQLFRDVEEFGGDRGFKLLHASRPLTQSRRRA